MKKPNAIFAAIAATLILGTTSVNALPSNASNALKKALDDEYKAYTTYQVVIEKFGDVRPFSNIIQAEMRHIEMLKDLMVKYRIPIAANPYLAGVNRPIAPSSLREACEVGIQAEIDNAGLYENQLLPMVADYDDIKFVFENLRDASQQRHLQAFQRCASRF